MSGISDKDLHAIDVQQLNALLPADIRFFGVKRVTKTFNPRTSADRRTYSYTLPTIAMAHQDIQTSINDYRIDAETLKNVHDILQIYKGYKNYHNFTIKKEYFERSSIRAMNSLDIDEPYVRNDVEFLTIRINGASFMMHQIRKMIGLMLAVVRGIAPPSLYEEVFDSCVVDLPTAPGLGLVLEQVHYDKYDRAFADLHTDLTWNEYEKELNAFRDEFILPTIIKGEIERNSMLSWVESLNWHTYETVSASELSKIRKSRRSQPTFYDGKGKTNNKSNDDDDNS